MVEPDAAGPVEVWLRQTNMKVSCTVVHEDEHTQSLDVDSLSIRGAQREMTGWFIQQGYRPVGRWSTEAGSDGEGIEVSRRFVPTTG
jgi:hypothetical protein